MSNNENKYWNWIILVFGIFSLIVIPFNSVMYVDLSQVIIYFIYLIDLIFIADIVKNLLNKKESKQYLKTYFIIDLLGNLPILYLAFNDISNVFQIFVFLRIFRFSRLLRSFTSFREHLWKISGYVRIIKFLMAVGIAIHWIACSWYFIALFEGFPTDSWIVREGIKDSDTLTSYIRSFYWTVITMTTVGYGDITPARNIEYVFSTVIAILGASSYAFVIGNISSMINNIDAAKSKYKIRVDSMTQYLLKRKAPVELIKKIKEYHDHIWNKNGGKEDQILSDLPDTLKTEILNHLTQDFITNSPIFKYSSNLLKRVLISSLKQQTIPPDSIFMYEGEVGNEIIFLHSGKAEIIHPEIGKNKYLGPGDYCGHMSIILNEKRTASVKTNSYCDIFSLSRVDFEKIKKEYPEFKTVLSNLSKSRGDKISELMINGILL